MGDDVHHIIPKEEGGQGVIENASLLCVECHALYGHRKEKRNQLRQARDDWYTSVARKYTAEQITKNNVEAAIAASHTRDRSMFTDLESLRRQAAKSSLLEHIADGTTVSITARDRDRRLKGHTSKNFKISDHDFQTIKIQLRALSLISKSARPRSLRDTATYWTLTPYGDQVLTTLRAIPATDVDEESSAENGSTKEG